MGVRPRLASQAWPLLPLAVAGSDGLLALAWTAIKVGALSYGGGFVIVPLMQGDAVDRFHWMTDAQFLNAVALGQVTPGPVTHTVAVVGYGAAGLGGALLASLIAWQAAVLAAAAIAVLVLRQSVVLVLIAAGAIGTLAALLGASLPGG